MLPRVASGTHIRPLIRTRLAGAWPRLCVVLACLAALGVKINTAEALDLEAAPLQPQWCFSQTGNGDRPVCYENMLACMLAAFGRATSCTKRASTPAPSAPLHPARHRARKGPRQHQLTTAERAELYREFQLWQERQQSSPHQ